MATLSLAASIVLGGWLLALVLGVKLLRTRRRLHQALSRSQNTGDTADKRQRVQDVAVRNLIVLRLELQRLTCEGDIDSKTGQQLKRQIDEYWTDSLLGSDPQRCGQDLRERRDAGWRILAAHGRVPQSRPPWKKPQPEKAPLIDAGALNPPSAPVMEADEDAPPQIPNLSTQTELSPEKKVISTAVCVSSKADKAQSSAAETTVSPAKAKPASHSGKSKEPARQHAWQPAEPSALEKVLHAASGWPRAVIPFLAQNIGWFIGVFCFLAGSVFLVSYTSGFAKALTVFIVVFCYTVFLIWVGYQLRLKQPKAKAASVVLMVMGMLLVPLDISAGARLLMSAGDSGTLWTMAFFAVLISLAVFAFAAQVISGAMDRVLQGQFPHLFLLLAGCQLLAPLLQRWPLWLLLALFHAVLLGLLSYGLLRYTNAWMHSIFVERHKIAYFAAGSLLYAVLVSFVHLTWGTGITELPKGYYAPYLMVASGLLFYMDVRFKTEVHRHSFLSHFTFFIYALSVCAVVLALDAPLARIITLGIAAAVYGLVLWKYLTLIPLYLLLGALGGLYASLVLQHVPPSWYFLLSLAPLYGVLTISRWAQGFEAGRPGAMRLALMSYRLTVALLIVVAAWSLAHCFAGWLAVSTALILAVVLWWILRLAPGPLLGALPVSCDEYVARDLRDSPWLYTVILAVTLALIFVPPWSRSHWVSQLAFGFVLLAVIWTWLSLQASRSDTSAAKLRTEVFSNSALLSAFAGLGIGGGLYTEQTLRVAGLGHSVATLGFDSWVIFTLLAALGLSSGVFMTLSLMLYVRWLFYLFLVTVALAAGLIKHSFFPGPSTGVVQTLVALALWGLLWWLDRQPDELSSLRRVRTLSVPPPRLLWLFQTGTEGKADTTGVVNRPDVNEPTQMESSVGIEDRGVFTQRGLHG